MLTAGKPNDFELYDGRYAVEDTRMALIEVRRKGIQPFCVRVDKKAAIIYLIRFLAEILWVFASRLNHHVSYPNMRSSRIR